MSTSSNGLIVGFASESLWGVWPTDKRLADALDVRAMAVGDGSIDAVVLIADLPSQSPATALELRRRAAKALGMNAAAVGIFTTQNHGAPLTAVTDGTIDAAADRYIRAARRALEARRPAEMAFLALRPSTPLTFHRRVRIDGAGVFTCWYGGRLDADGRGDYSDMLATALADLAAGRPYQRRGLEPADLAAGGPVDSPLPIDRPLRLEPAADDLLQALLFRTPDGEPIGSLVRIATHPMTANRKGADYHSGDYPVYLRRRMESRFGGEAIFLPGPCGDQAPFVGEKSLARAEELGGRIADVVLAAAGEATWTPVESIAVRSPEVELRIRDDYPASKTEATAAMESLAARLSEAAEAGRPLTELKALSDAWERRLYAVEGLLPTWTGHEGFGEAGRIITHPLFVLRVGTAVVAGLPGEPFSGYSTRMRRETIGDRLLTAEQGNGYLGYLPTAEEADLGGYGPNAALLDDSAEDRLAAAVADAVHDVGA